MDWSRWSIIDGSDGFITGFRHGFLGVLGGRVVDMTAQYANVDGIVVRVGGYANVVHGVGYVGQSAVVAGTMLGLTA